MGRIYVNSLFGYLFFVVFVQMSVMFMGMPFIVSDIIQLLQKHPFISMTLADKTYVIGGFGLFVFVIFFFLLSDAFISAFYAITFGKWAVKLEEDGIYGLGYFARFLNYLKIIPFKKLCAWEDVVEVRRKGLIDIDINRIYFKLRNGKRFAIVRVFTTPFQNKEYVDSLDEDGGPGNERAFRRYSCHTMFAYMMTRIDKSKWKRFNKEFWKMIEKAERELPSLMKEDAERKAKKEEEKRDLERRRKQWEEEERLEAERARKLEEESADNDLSEGEGRGGTRERTGNQM